MEEELIEFVKQNKFIYNKKSRHNKNMLLRDQKFEELSEKLNIPAKHLKNRWRTLKDKFHLELKREKYKCEHGKPTRGKRWKWMDKLEFLRTTEPPSASNSSEQDVTNDLKYFEAFTTSTSPFPDASSPEPDATMSSSRTLQRPINSSTNHELSELVVISKPPEAPDAITDPLQGDASAIHLFFRGLAKQTEDANLTPQQFAHLQLEILRTFNYVVYNNS